MGLAQDFYTLVTRGMRHSLRADVIAELPHFLHDLAVGPQRRYGHQSTTVDELQKLRVIMASCGFPTIWRAFLCQRSGFVILHGKNYFGKNNCSIDITRRLKRIICRIRSGCFLAICSCEGWLINMNVHIWAIQTPILASLRLADRAQ